MTDPLELCVRPVDDLWVGVGADPQHAPIVVERWEQAVECREGYDLEMVRHHEVLWLTASLRPILRR